MTLNLISPDYIKLGDMTYNLTKCQQWIITLCRRSSASFFDIRNTQGLFIKSKYIREYILNTHKPSLTSSESKIGIQKRNPGSPVQANGSYK